MGASDRDYFREEAKRYASGRVGAGGMPPVSKGLLIVLAVVSLLVLLTGFDGIEAMSFSWGRILQGKVWELVTFSWVHPSLVGMIFAGLMFYFISPQVERWWGSWSYAGFLLVVVFGTLAAYALVYGLGLSRWPLRGSSGWTLAMLLSLAVIDPNVRVKWWIPPVELSMRTLVLAVAGISLLFLLVDFARGAPWAWMEASHLCGAAAGWAVTRWPSLLVKGRKGPARVALFRRSWRKGGMSGSVTSKAKGTKVGGNRNGEAKLRPRTTLEVEEDAAVDRILDKIHREGIGSLTQEEKNLLEKAAKKQEGS